MTTLQTLLDSSYPLELFEGMVVNFHIAALALALGLALGIPLVVMQRGGRVLRGVSTPLLGLMRAAPTFVVMFFLLNILASSGVFGRDGGLSAPTIVALSLLPYAAAYVADNGGEAVTSWQEGSTGAALLFLPGLVRAYVVLVMSSSTGAAIGVNEGVSAVLREAERWPDLPDKLIVFAIGVLAFGVVFQIGFALVRVAVRLLSRPKSVSEVTA